MKSVWINRIGSTYIEVGWKLDCSDRIGTVQGFNIYYCPIVSPYNLSCKGKWIQNFKMNELACIHVLQELIFWLYLDISFLHVDTTSWVKNWYTLLWILWTCNRIPVNSHTPDLRHLQHTYTQNTDFLKWFLLQCVNDIVIICGLVSSRLQVTYKNQSVKGVFSNS